jgi:hypothetical protein
VSCDVAAGLPAASAKFSGPLPTAMLAGTGAVTSNVTAMVCVCGVA